VSVSDLQQHLADRYRIERELGQGGMATVYLAHDVRHDRKVAIKVLRPELAAVIGADRFLAEIRTTANLQHPHILALFDSGAVEGTVFYVMPFVDGESLRDRLTREKQLPVDDALRIAREVADALGYAHGHGVIHRDIKPENILLHGGHALVADFGIALAASRTGGTRMTETGMSLGTPQYMSPEQAMGERDLDARTDIYALGCVTYEMLVGDPPFTASTAQGIVAKVMTEKPASIISRRDRVPEHVEDAVLTALQKLPADRFESARAFSDALGSPALTREKRTSSVRMTWLQRHAMPVVAVLGVIAAASIGFAIRRSSVSDAAVVNRFDLVFDPNQALAPTGGIRVAWSRDGRSFVYSGAGPGGTSQLLLRSLDSLAPVPVAGTTGASSPFFSPDGQSIAYVTTSPFSLRVVPRSGGTARTVVTGDSVSGGGGDWGEDGYIYFDGATTISRIRPDGTGRQVLATLDTLRHEIGLAWPQALPGGRGVIFRARRTGEDVGQYSIDAADGRTHARKHLVAATVARYVSGYLLYVLADGTLMASRFDLGKLALTGTPLVIAHNLDLGAFGAADLALSPGGSLLYSAGGGVSGVEPVWVARDGATSKVDPAWNNVFGAGVALSPDNTRLAVDENAQSGASTSRSEDIWVKQLPAGPLSRLTFEGEQNTHPAWSPDGRDILFVSSRSGPASLYRQRADGSAPATPFLPPGKPADNQTGTALMAEGLASPDGRWIVAQTETTTPGDGDIMALQAGVDTTWRPIVATGFQELAPALSPDGHWLAYSSNETGRAEVYVRPFPDAATGKIQVSTTGGTVPHWTRKGDELFYVSADNEMMAARVRTAPAFAVLATTRLFSTAGFLTTSQHDAYDVTADGQRFLMLRPETGTTTDYAAPHVILVEHFIAYLKRLLP
jgi:serine/threonine-protein kinase